ncbi:MAG: lipase family protein [Candidatus Competibacteraceae bacterium]|nr:lipase family protein [Candidatus Competibacteraceae bacterium]
MAIRGTEKSSAHDWLTNLRMAGVQGPSGYTVHTGFWKLASGILPQVREALRGRNPTVIHVIGHSLGGAAATLVADALHGSSVAGVKLYTFGAPRAGVELHASALTGRLGRENIFRAYHHTDPVPMVPVFPYAHVPYEEEACLLRGSGTLLSVNAHLMPTYLSSVGEQSWRQLRLAQSPKLDTFEAADRWLAEAARGDSISIMLSASALRMILWALRWVLRKAGEMIGYALLGGATIIDYLAKLIYLGTLQSISLARAVENMIAAILRFTGRTLAAGTKLTDAFIQYVLELLFRTVATVAMRAVNQLP